MDCCHCALLSQLSKWSKENNWGVFDWFLLLPRQIMIHWENVLCGFQSIFKQQPCWRGLGVWRLVSKWHIIPGQKFFGCFFFLRSEISASSSFKQSKEPTSIPELWPLLQNILLSLCSSHKGNFPPSHETLWFYRKTWPVHGFMSSLGQISQIWEFNMICGFCFLRNFSDSTLKPPQATMQSN